ncbi:MAG: response regulator [Anaerolineae bacterium]|nr:response regulator [Anaerolineae bacterium]MCO5187746.1 response regulator [Anaerolineae bacterium]MCO5193692.1 response regulator [Anaerolineae bacterium]MCO5199726.1 response regulator [Anaerolineae bacterium]MCO5206564.1 response regulator [Anaerolineae bacterium]
MKILIADDEAIIRMGLKSMLAELGHTVFEATNGREALQIVQHQHPELALLDIQMPYTDGLHVARAIERVRPIPVVILTAFGQKELVDKASEYPIHGYLIKPVQSAELNAALAVATRRFAETRALLAEKARLEQALATRKLIDRAKGRLMESGLTEEEAYQAVQRHARERRISMADAAREILEWQ